ncbi:Asp-tRNA(Asn)/Glu-tRNA(Gln) amidotransferase subunit GatA, partial [Candidatus Saccharibacteria bacterium]|nr:Asp-tRNA(Asn)/Glu-tRNA(Gln) amidotransferase subunit GatA [Candidatus Saccharibacteria bacterium]
DSTTIPRQNSYIPTTTPSRLTVGIIKEYLAEGIDPDVKQAILDAAKKIEADGNELVEISLPSLPLALAVYYIVVPAEISSNLGRYDGQRFGHSVSSDSVKDLQGSYESAREQGFGDEAKRRIMTGTYVLSSGYYDAYYKKAQIVRTKIVNEFKAAFESVDFLLGPVAPDIAFKIGELSDPLSLYLLDIMTVAASLAGLPAISVPCDTVKDMPVGLQLIAPYKHDAELIELAAQFEGLQNG